MSTKNSIELRLGAWIAKAEYLERNLPDVLLVEHNLSTYTTGNGRSYVTGSILVRDVLREPGSDRATLLNISPDYSSGFSLHNLTVGLMRYGPRRTVRYREDVTPEALLRKVVDRLTDLQKRRESAEAARKINKQEAEIRAARWAYRLKVLAEVAHSLSTVVLGEAEDYTIPLDINGHKFQVRDSKKEYVYLESEYGQPLVVKTVMNLNHGGEEARTLLLNLGDFLSSDRANRIEEGTQSA